MKLLVIDLDQNTKKLETFVNEVSSILAVEVEVIPLIEINNSKKYFFEKIVKGGFTLEEKLLNDFRDYFFKKEYCNVIFVWGDYSTEKILFLKKYVNVFIEDLLIFPKDNLEKDVNWLFGNVIAMTKLTTSLYKIDLSLIHSTDGRNVYGNTNVEMIALYWYAARINLNLKLIIDL